MKSNDQSVARTFSVQTSHGVVENVPVIQWEELAPYWRAICRAIFEVLIENDFYPYTATLKRPNGFVASSHYWRISLKDPTKAPLSEARFFIYKLKEKAYFSESIRRFNQNIQTDWLEEKNIAVLGGYLYSFYYTLKPVLKAVRKGAKDYLKPIISKKQRM